MRRASRKMPASGMDGSKGGPLLPVKNEYYQAGLGVEALRALSNLARLVGKEDISKQLAAEFEHSEPALDQLSGRPKLRAMHLR